MKTEDESHSLPQEGIEEKKKAAMMIIHGRRKGATRKKTSCLQEKKITMNRLILAAKGLRSEAGGGLSGRAAQSFSRCQDESIRTTTAQ